MSTKSQNPGNSNENNDNDGDKLVCPFLRKNKNYELGAEFGILFVKMMIMSEICDDFRIGNQEQILLLANRMKWQILEVGDCKKGFFHLEMIDPSKQEEYSSNEEE